MSFHELSTNISTTFWQLQIMILGDNPPTKNTPRHNPPPTPTDPRHGVLTLTLTDPRGWELSENWRNPHF